MNENTLPRHWPRMPMHKLISIVVVATVVYGSVAGQPKPTHPVSLQAKLSQDRIHAGSVVAAAIVADIKPGWHINSPAPADENMIATTVAIERGNVLDSVAVRFPQGHEMQFGFAESPLEVYDGTLLISLKLHIASTLHPGVYAVPITLRYQACNDNVCLPPASVSAVLDLVVVSLSEPVNQINTALFRNQE